MQVCAMNCNHSTAALEAFQWLNLHYFRIHRVVIDAANAMSVIDTVICDFVCVVVLRILALECAVCEINDKSEGSDMLDRARSCRDAIEMVVVSETHVDVTDIVVEIGDDTGADVEMATENG
jgi:hypothetical protein